MANIVGMGVEAVVVLGLALVLDWPVRRPPWYELLWCGALVYLDFAGFLHGLEGWARGRAEEPVRAVLYFCLVVLFALIQVLSAITLSRMIFRSCRDAPGGRRKVNLLSLWGFLPQGLLAVWRGGVALPAVIALGVIALPAWLGAAERTRRRMSRSLQ